jgi:hypothetical protein
MLCSWPTPMWQLACLQLFSRNVCTCLPAAICSMGDAWSQTLESYLCNITNQEQGEPRPGLDLVTSLRGFCIRLHHRWGHIFSNLICFDGANSAKLLKLKQPMASDHLQPDIPREASLFTVVRIFVLGPRLILGIRELNAKLVTDSDAATVRDDFNRFSGTRACSSSSV